MARALTAATQTALDTGRIVGRATILLDLGSGLYGFWTGIGPFVSGGVTYIGAGTLISVEAVRQSSGLESVPIVGRLTAVENTDLTPNTLAAIEAETYHQRPVTLGTAYFNADTYALLSHEVEYRGYIDRIVHTENVDGEAVLEVHAESRFRDHSRSNYRVRSDVDQKLIAASDDGLRHVVTVTTERILFGRVEQPPVMPQKKKKSFFGLF